MTHALLSEKDCTLMKPTLSTLEQQKMVMMTTMNEERKMESEINMEEFKKEQAIHVKNKGQGCQAMTNKHGQITYAMTAPSSGGLSYYNTQTNVLAKFETLKP